MLTIGDIVVTMSYSGMFTVVALDGDQVVITDGNGVTRTVLSANVRRVTREPGSS
jgi:hypothetical protein